MILKPVCLVSIQSVTDNHVLNCMLYNARKNKMKKLRGRKRFNGNINEVFKNCNF